MVKGPGLGFSKGLQECVWLYEDKYAVERQEVETSQQLMNFSMFHYIDGLLYL